MSLIKISSKLRLSFIFRTKSYKLSKSNIQQNQSYFSNENCCQKCLSCFDGRNFSMAILPIKFTKRKSQRFREKTEQNAKKGPAMKLMSRKTNNIVVSINMIPEINSLLSKNNIFIHSIFIENDL